jgi:CheY-like chemotaxis protein
MGTKSTIALLVQDMFFAAKIRSAAEIAGRRIESIKSLDQLEAGQAADSIAMVIIDLNSQGLNPLEMIKLIKDRPELRDVPVIGFVSHVQVDLKRAAEEAGCDYVIPRSLFSMKLPEIAAGDFSSLPPHRATTD